MSVAGNIGLCQRARMCQKPTCDVMYVCSSKKIKFTQRIVDFVQTESKTASTALMDCTFSLLEIPSACINNSTRSY